MREIALTAIAPRESIIQAERLCTSVVEARPVIFIFNPRRAERNGYRADRESITLLSPSRDKLCCKNFKRIIEEAAAGRPRQRLRRK